MPTSGGRTAFRVSSDMFVTSPLKTKVPNVIPANMVCKGLCEVFCGYKKIVVDELIKGRPDLSINIVREALTDLTTASDLLGGGQCECDCDNLRGK